MWRSIPVGCVSFLLLSCTFYAESEDISLDRHYQLLALKHVPTLFHQVGTTFFPVNVCFDEDYLASNNRAFYDGHSGQWNKPWVYIHILRDTSSGKIYIQYWFYYVYNFYFTGSHNDDWELLVVILDRNETPLEVWFGWHGFLHKELWSSVEKTVSSSTHPTAFADAGSHAMYAHCPHPLWSGDKFTTWEEILHNHYYTFLGREIERAFEGETLAPISVIEAAGYTLLYRRVVPVSGDVALPTTYGEPDTGFSPITAPWMRSIWNVPEQNTY